MVRVSSLNEARSGTFPRIVLSLVVVWTIALLGPSGGNVSKAIAQQVARLSSIQLDWGHDSDGRRRYNSSKLAVMIETRNVTSLAPQLLHMAAVAPPDWPFLFLGSAGSMAMINTSRAIRDLVPTGKLRLQELPTDLHSKEGAHRLLTLPYFYDTIVPHSVEWLFVFGSDSILCANSASSLDEWLGYDWVGAPFGDWQKDDQGNQHRSSSGGFSLRRVSTMRRVLSFQERLNDTVSEDEFFAYRLPSIPDIHMPDPVLESQFVVEHFIQTDALAYHLGDWTANPDVWNDEQTRFEIWQYCPEIKMVTSPMKLLREKC